MKVIGIEMAKLDRRTLVMFSPVRNALNREIINHPQLMEKLRQQPIADFEEKLALISAYCGIAVDGEFTQKEVDTLCELCLKELKKRNVQILLPI
jgi:hypothetical protein